jgi:arylsulfatase
MVMYSTDNGPHMNSWPDAAMTPFRSEKNSMWEGAYRVPCLVRWPGVIKPGTVINDIVSHLDWLPTIVDAAGDPNIKNKLKKGGVEANGKKFKVHLDGFSLMPFFNGKKKKPDRQGFFYFTDDGDLACLRYDNWKVAFLEQRARGTLQIWAEPFVALRVPKIFNLRTDPYERADITSNTYYDWLLDHVFILVPAQAGVAEFLETFKEFPPRQKAASFSVDQVMEKMKESVGGGMH